MRTVTAGQQLEYQISHALIGFMFSNPIGVLGGNCGQRYASALREDPCETVSRRIAKFVTPDSESCRHPIGLVTRVPPQTPTTIPKKSANLSPHHVSIRLHPRPIGF